MPETTLCFSKNEKLKKKKDIELIFSSGIKITARPFIVLYTITTDTSSEDQPVHFGISASKKKHRNAATRNLIKRKGREAYRLAKSDLFETVQKANLSLNMMFIYTSSKVLEYKHFEEGINTAISKLKIAINDYKCD